MKLIRLILIVGLQEMTVDKEKDLVMVKGTMDVKALAKSLRNRIKRTVKIVPPKKVKDSGGRRGDGNKKDDNGGGSGGGKTKGGGGDAGQEEDGGGGKKRMEVFGHPEFGYYDHGYGYGNGYGHANGWEWEWICAWILRTLYPWVDGGPVGWALAPNMFSEENPNACSIM